MVMGILTNLKNGGKVFDVATTLLDQAVLTPQEKADKSIEYQERTGSTPSSQSRRWVTKFMLLFISSIAVLNIILFRFDPAWGEFAFNQLKEFCSNWVIITIVAFFYGGYYAKNILSDKQKSKQDMKQKDHEIKIKQKELDLEKEKNLNDIKIDRKQSRQNRRSLRRNS